MKKIIIFIMLVINNLTIHSFNAEEKIKTEELKIINKNFIHKQIDAARVATRKIFISDDFKNPLEKTINSIKNYINDEKAFKAYTEKIFNTIITKEDFKFFDEIHESFKNKGNENDKNIELGIIIPNHLGKDIYNTLNDFNIIIDNPSLMKITLLYAFINLENINKIRINCEEKKTTLGKEIIKEHILFFLNLLFPKNTTLTEKKIIISTVIFIGTAIIGKAILWSLQKLKQIKYPKKLPSPLKAITFGTLMYSLFNNTAMLSLIKTSHLINNNIVMSIFQNKMNNIINPDKINAIEEQNDDKKNTKDNNKPTDQLNKVYTSEFKKPYKTSLIVNKIAYFTEVRPETLGIVNLILYNITYYSRYPHLANEEIRRLFLLPINELIMQTENPLKKKIEENNYNSLYEKILQKAMPETELYITIKNLITVLTYNPHALYNPLSNIILNFKDLLPFNAELPNIPILKNIDSKENIINPFFE